MRVLLRAWPNKKIAGAIGLEKIVETDDVMANDDDPFFIVDLGREVPVEKRPDEAPEGVECELRFLVYPSEFEKLPSLGWKKIADACPACSHA